MSAHDRHLHVHRETFIDKRLERSDTERRAWSGAVQDHTQDGVDQNGRNVRTGPHATKAIQAVRERAQLSVLSLDKTASTPPQLVSTTPTAGSRSSSWSTKDDETLIQARAQGLNWNQINPKYFPSKSPNACRKRHERLMERQNADRWDGGVKLDALALAYMETRREMWSILATRVGEEWQFVEQKCMDKGLKNLNEAYRSGKWKHGTYDRSHGNSSASQSDSSEDLPTIPDMPGLIAMGPPIRIRSQQHMTSSVHSTIRQPISHPTNISAVRKPSISLEAAKEVPALKLHKKPMFTLGGSSDEDYTSDSQEIPPVLRRPRSIMSLGDFSGEDFQNSKDLAPASRKRTYVPGGLNGRRRNVEEDGNTQQLLQAKRRVSAAPDLDPSRGPASQLQYKQATESKEDYKHAQSHTQPNQNDPTLLTAGNTSSIFVCSTISQDTTSRGIQKKRKLLALEDRDVVLFTKFRKGPDTPLQRFLPLR